MDVLRRNTDYALRAMIYLARQYDLGPASTRDIAASESISYQLACKLMQKLASKKLVKSLMGAKGGYILTKKPEKINIGQIVKSIQGPINLNRCLLGSFKCPKKRNCTVRIKLIDLQDHIDSYFKKVTLADLIKA
jgi:Rrf2 family protein